MWEGHCDMTPEVLFDLVFLLLFTLCEVLGILYYLAPLVPLASLGMATPFDRHLLLLEYTQHDFPANP